MQVPKFKLVDCGCYMLETCSARWIIKHPTNGYLPAKSKLWDVLVEHPDTPHTSVLKYLGSFKTKREAIKMITEKQLQSVNYLNAAAISNKFYNEDYTLK